MDIGGVRAALHRAPFEPFVIRLADGRAEPIHHPDFVALSKRLVYVVREDDTWMTIEPLLIVSLDKLSPPGKSGNGSQRRKPKS
jgi:hypothetical protein